MGNCNLDYKVPVRRRTLGDTEYTAKENDMYYLTTFEWKGGLKNIPIPAYEAPEGQPGMVIASLEIGVEHCRQGFMTIEFKMEDGESSIFARHGAYEFMTKIVDNLKFGGHSAVDGKYRFTLSPVNGEPLTESMMGKYLLLIKLCGIHTFAPPRIVTEGFAGKHRGDKSDPYGKFLMEKMLRQQYA